MSIQTISILGAGWLGLPLGAALVREGYTVKGSTKSPDKLSLLREKGLHPYPIQVTAEGLRGEIADFFECDLLIITLPPGGR
ncbi:MAG: hypothetical protein KDC54_23760, partial [Lewinella sp.]|nr:hypothetical protein [Lewinella sp.]